MPFAITGLITLHLDLLHEVGSTEPLGLESPRDYIVFWPYFVIKDVYSLSVALLIFSVITFFYPNVLGHPDNYIPANPLVTPAHIVPEWYFLPFYAILRAVPDKFGGVIAMFLSIVALGALPFITKVDAMHGTRFLPLRDAIF